MLTAGLPNITASTARRSMSSARANLYKNPFVEPVEKTNQFQMVPAIAASCLHLRTGNSAMHLTPARLTKPICRGQCIFKLRLCEGFMIHHSPSRCATL